MAAIIQVPMAISVTTPVLLSTEQTVGVVLLYLTARPELAVAVTVAVLPKASGGATPKLILCGYAVIAGPSLPQPASDPTEKAARTMPNPRFLKIHLVICIISAL